jgi:hypothetical protein
MLPLKIKVGFAWCCLKFRYMCQISQNNLSKQVANLEDVVQQVIGSSKE